MGVGIAFVQFEACTPEFVVGAAGYDRSWVVGSEEFFDAAEAEDQALAVGAVEAIFGGFAEGYGENV